MIPKIIHYCWLSNDPIPDKLQVYMQSWKKHLHDYEFIKWDFNRFPKDRSEWVRDAFNAKKYAYAADYIRLYALYNYGGFYLDMDVEIVKSYEPFLSLNTLLGFENSKQEGLEVAAFGVEKKSAWVKICLDHYDNRHYVNSDGSVNDIPMPGIIKHCLLVNGYKLKKVSSISEASSVASNEIPVFPSDFFSPKNHVTGKIERTLNTVSIHHFAGSWLPVWQQKESLFWYRLGLRDMRILLRIKNLLMYGSIKSVPAKSLKNKNL